MTDFEDKDGAGPWPPWEHCYHWVLPQMQQSKCCVCGKLKDLPPMPDFSSREDDYADRPRITML